MPAFIEKVLATSGADKLHYIGHSMGTTIFYVLGSERPDLMEKVRLAVHLAPVTYWSRIQSAVAKRAFQAAAVLKVRLPPFQPVRRSSPASHLFPSNSQTVFSVCLK